MDTFVRFINLMMNDVTFLLDESLGKLSEISGIQHEMEAPNWATQNSRHHQERQGLLRSLEGQATSWLALGRSTLDLLEKFTRETRSAFMVPEIVDRLAAMLTYNLDFLVGPKCQDLKVKDPEKYKFNPRQLLSDILQVFLNLSQDPAFVMALATEGRSYRQSLFDRAAGIAKKRALKTDPEIEQLRVLVEQVEQRRLTLRQEEEEEGDVPDEFLGKVLNSRLKKALIS
jgi:ubiquitin conjugation factor E4 B